MTITRLPNAQLLLSEFLRQDTDITAIFGDEIYTNLPPDQNTWPACRLTRIGGGAIGGSQPLVLDQVMVQVDVWGGRKVDAEAGAQTIRAVCAARLTGKHRTGVVYGVDIGSLRDVPDDTFDPARPRYLFDLSFVVRAL